MRGVAEKVKLYTDIPVSVGIAPSKTLAKMGSKFAKQYKGYRSVCMIEMKTNEEKLWSYSNLQMYGASADRHWPNSITWEYTRP